MCGICGIRSDEPGAVLAPRLESMVRTLTHRGPDAGGVLVANGIAFGHRRLRIIDLSERGAQPMTTGAATVTYNGEIYNFRELRAELERRGHAFRSQSDTEVLLATYREWGLEGLPRLEGIFAFALWDAAARRLVLMRDRLGVKPLFYAWSGAHLYFGSEIKAILASGAIDRTVDDQALSEYLWYGNAFEERTIFRAVRAVPPGHWLIADERGAQVEAWWRIEEWLDAAKAPRTRADAAIAVRAAVDAAVARQLVSDVPVGIFLSGGVDSSSIAAAAVRAASQPLRSYSVGFDFDDGINELPKARRVAESLGLDHHELTVGGDDLGDVLVDLARAHDEPFADAANIPLYLLARALNHELKVVLQGDGGDEMFAGYRRYLILRHASAWRLWPRGLTPFARRADGYGIRVARMAAAAGHPDPAMRMALLLTVETCEEPPTAMLAGDARARLERECDPFAAFRRCAERFRGADAVNQMLLTDIHLQLASQFLPKVDRATMAHGLEARVPLLDERVAALAVNLPSTFKAQGSEKKIVLRDAMRGRLPDDVLDGPKIGFGVPYQRWLRGSLYGMAREAMLAADFVQRFDVDRARVECALEQHRSGASERGFVLWKLFQLALWSSIVH